jgi:hypothetical protein
MVETVPQYRPTPIAELERRRREQRKPVKSTDKTGKFVELLIDMMVNNF